jgi:predicted transcriptional regulator
LITEALIDKNYISLNSEMTVGEACAVFNDSNQSDLPVVDSEEFKGVLFKNQLKGREDDDLKLKELESQFKLISVLSDTRMVSALKKMVTQGVAYLPVIDHSSDMIGVLTSGKLWGEFASRSSLLGDGSWIIVSMPQKDYSLSKLAHLVESHRLMIVMHFVQFYQGTESLDVHIKVNRENVNELIQSLQRYGFEVTGVIQPKKFVDDWEDKFEELMRFFST